MTHRLSVGGWKMKLFQTIREYIQDQNDRISGKIFKASFLYGFNSILNCAFLFHKAKTFREYTDDIYMTSATIVITFSFVMVIVKMSRLFKFINRCERITEKSKQFSSIFKCVRGRKIDFVFRFSLFKFTVSVRAYSIGISRIESYLRWNKSTHWKLDTCHLFFCHESHSNSLDIPNICG